MNTQTAALAAAIISGLGIVVQIGMAVYNNSQLKKLEQKKIDADIISKSRMQWINETRKLTSDFMNDATFLLAQITMYCEKSVQGAEYTNKVIELESSKISLITKARIEEFSKLIEIIDEQQIRNADTLNTIQEKMVRERILIKLQFSDNPENNEIVEKVESITNGIREFVINVGWSQFTKIEHKKSLRKKAVILRESKQEEIEALVDILRGYYKKEWEKVKIGE